MLSKILLAAAFCGAGLGPYVAMSGYMSDFYNPLWEGLPVFGLTPSW